MRKSFDELRAGEWAEESVDVDTHALEACVAFSGDDNPVHLSDSFAQSAGLPRRIAHGLLQLGILSRLIGTALPGHGAVWSAVDLSFVAPVFFGERLSVRATVRHVSPAIRALTLDVTGTSGGREVLRGSVRVTVPDNYGDG